MKKEDSTPLCNAPILPSELSGEKALRKISIRRIVTTSWDDGDPLDLRVAELLAERNLPGTFYIPMMGHVEENHPYRLMESSEMLELNSQGFEIGAHGVSSANLPSCDETQLTIEVESCKKRLEQDLGKPVTMFAYPRGRHNKRVIASLKRAGYAGARTTAMMAHGLNFQPFQMPTTVHVFPHSRLEYLRNLARVWDMRRTWVYATHLQCGNNWVEFAKLIFDAVLSDGGLWHLYGHSWEIEELRLWDGLREVLDYVSNRPGVHYLANGPIVNLQAQRRLGVECGIDRTLNPQSEGHEVQTGSKRHVEICKEGWS